MDLQARADRLAHLIETRLDVRGTGLEAKLKHAGRLLPRHIRDEAGLIVTALHLQSHPKLARRFDDARIETACHTVERYLKGIDPGSRRMGLVLDWLTQNAFNLLVLAALIAAVLAWRGFL